MHNKSSAQYLFDKQSTSVGIIGCGWLGTALAKLLQQQDISVLATRSNTEHVEELATQNINAEVLLLPAEQSSLNNHPVFKQSCLVIAITPQFRQGKIDYAEKVKQLVDAAYVNANVEKIILLSSTAIYNGLPGLVDENCVLDLTADKVALLSQAEQAVLSFNEGKVNKEKGSAYVLRLSGLVGPNRHPGKFLLSGRLLKNSQAIVNLIHQHDAAALILSLVINDAPVGIYNGVSATKVTKKEFYQAAATALSLSPPKFDESEGASDFSAKIVSGTKTSTMLNYSFMYNDLLAWLKSNK